MRTAIHSSFFTVLLIGAAVLVLPAASADAQIFGLLDKAEKKCRTSLAKSFSKTVTTADKTIAKCHKDRNAGKRPPGDDCNDPAVADTKGKLGKSQDKLIDTATKKCGGADDGARLQFVSCPEPCASTAPVANPLASYDDVATCLACLAGDIASRRNAVILGDPNAPLDDPTTGKADQKCHQKVAKGYGKHLKTLLKDRTKCQSDADKIDEYDTTVCRSSDSKSKILGAQTKAEADVQANCAGIDLSEFNLTGGCAAAASELDLATCASTESNTTGDESFDAHYALAESGDVCPVSITAVTQAGTSPDLVATATRVDAGFTGLGHDADFVHGFAISYAITCPEEGRCSDDQGISCSTNVECGDICIQAAPCGNCSLDGVIDSGNDQFSAFSRCKDDPAIECDAPFTIDAECAGTTSGECVFFVGPPLPVNAGSTPACAMPRLIADTTGTYNADTGDMAFVSDLRTKIYLGQSQSIPCPVCQGDDVPQDGIKNGSCFGGNSGAPCDVQGVEATFANPNNGDGLSLDCGEPVSPNVSNDGLELATPITTGTSSLSFDTECGFPQLPGTKCACAVCSLSIGKACQNNADCGPGEGTCSSNGGGSSRAPNGCSDQTCTPLGGGVGECQAGVGTDIVTYCDGALRANGNPYLTCTTNADCIALDNECGGDCGDCVATQTRSCFVDPITVSGVPDTVAPVGVSTFCVPPTANTGINDVTGLPGPSRTVIQLQTLRNFF